MGPATPRLRVFIDTSKRAKPGEFHLDSRIFQMRVLPLVTTAAKVWERPELFAYIAFTAFTFKGETECRSQSRSS